MRKIGQKYVLLWIIAALFGLLGGLSAQTETIALDAVRPGMEGYCLTVWAGTAVEKFPLKVLSIVRNQKPGSDMILVRVNEPRFEKAGAIHGCSGSPVYLEGKLAGALAAGWDGSLEPLYYVRPIEEMLAVGTTPQPSAAPLHWPSAGGEGINLTELAAFYRESIYKPQTADSDRKPLPLSTSLPEPVCRSLSEGFLRMGFAPLPSGMSAGTADASAQTDLVPGGILAALLCSGDVQMAAVGTATHLDGQTVYGFGHSFTGNGPVEFPLAAGTVHTIVATQSYSFKLASAGAILGTIQFDQNAAVRGQIGVMPRTVPLRITVERFNDPKTRTWNCAMAYDRFFTPMIAQLVVAATAQMQGPFPTEHTLRYAGKIETNKGRAITFNNLSSGRNMADAATELFAALGILMNNPFEEIIPTGIELQITIAPSDANASIWTTTLSQTTVKPGQTITAELTLESFRTAKSKQSISLTVPNNLPPGKYPLQLMGAEPYAAFLRQNAPQRFFVMDASSLLEGLNALLDAPRGRLYAVLSVPATGLTLRRHTLGDLPPTRINLLQDAKRPAPIEPYRNWIESRIDGDQIIAGAVQIELTVEQP